MILRLIVLLSLAGAGWFLYTRFVKQRSPAIGDTADLCPDDERGGMVDRVTSAASSAATTAVHAAQAAVTEGGQTPGPNEPPAETVEQERTIKGNVRADGDKIYHLPSDPAYERTNAEQWFASVQEAEAAGFRRAGRPRGD